MKLFKKKETTPSVQIADAPIKVLGTGCKTCHQLYEAVAEAVRAVSPEIPVAYITDLSVIAGYGVMVTPALVIDEKVVSVGKVLSVEEVKELLENRG